MYRIHIVIMFHPTCTSLQTKCVILNNPQSVTVIFLTYQTQSFCILERMDVNRLLIREEQQSFTLYLSVTMVTNYHDRKYKIQIFMAAWKWGGRDCYYVFCTFDLLTQLMLQEWSENLFKLQFSINEETTCETLQRGTWHSKHRLGHCIT